MFNSRIKKTNFSKTLEKEWNTLKNNLLIKEINLDEYTKIYSNKFFFNNSHIQAPGYYLNQHDVKYLKLFKKEKIIAICSLLNKGFFFNTIYIARLNNGPLITKEFIDYKNYILIYILYFIKSNYTRLISFAPPSLYMDKESFMSFNIAKLTFPSINTYLLDLLNTKEYIYKNLKKNWRNGLKKGLKYTEVKKINDPQIIKEVLSDYKNYAKEIGFKPTSIEKCYQWFQNSLRNKSLLYLKIYQCYNFNNSEKSIGSIGILCFKESAIYLFGFTTNSGKKYQANVVLLWEAIIDLKNEGFKKFDLGGFNKKTPKGIIKFKQGLNGLLKETLGEYFYFGIF